MAFELEYHSSVICVVNRSGQRSIPAFAGLLGILLLVVFLVSSGFAQIGSANSSGAAHSVSAAPPTGSIAPPTAGIAPPTGASSVHDGFGSHNSGVIQSGFPHSSIPFNGHHDPNVHHHPPHNSSSDTVVYPYFYGVPAPYDADAADADAPDDDAEYQGGPTVFDRRGSGAASYIPPSYHGPAHAQNQSSQDPSSGDASARSGADPAAESPQLPTTLVFKDGHQLEVENYAIVAHTLYDLTPGRPRKIALADLDLPATEKQNDDRGVTFQLPPSVQGN